MNLYPTHQAAIQAIISPAIKTGGGNPADYDLDELACLVLEFNSINGSEGFRLNPHYNGADVLRIANNWRRDDQPETRPINRADYADRQAQILSAMQLIEDLAQDAYEHGQAELSVRLHQAYDDVEKFRILPARASDVLLQMHLETEAKLAHLTPHQRVTYNIARREHVHAKALAIAESDAA